MVKYVKPFNITDEMYWRDDMAKLQDYSCGICHRKFDAEIKAVIDHDHSTGLIRGYLCRSCNYKLAALDNHTWLKNAKSYLSNNYSSIKVRHYKDR